MGKGLRFEVRIRVRLRINGSGEKKKKSEENITKGKNVFLFIPFKITQIEITN